MELNKQRDKVPVNPKTKNNNTTTNDDFCNNVLKEVP